MMASGPKMALEERAAAASAGAAVGGRPPPGCRCSLPSIYCLRNPTQSNNLASYVRKLASAVQRDVNCGCMQWQSGCDPAVCSLEGQVYGKEETPQAVFQAQVGNSIGGAAGGQHYEAQRRTRRKCMPVVQWEQRSACKHLTSMQVEHEVTS